MNYKTKYAIGDDVMWLSRQLDNSTKPCPTCDGKRCIPAPDNTYQECKRCHGRGRAPDSKAVIIRELSRVVKVILEGKPAKGGLTELEISYEVHALSHKSLNPVRTKFERQLYPAPPLRERSAS